MFSSFLNSVLKYEKLSFILLCAKELVLFLPTGLGECGLSEELALLGWRLLLFGNERLDSDACKAQLLDKATNSSCP